MQLFFEERLFAGQVVLKETLRAPQVPMYLKPDFKEFVVDLNGHLLRHNPFEKIGYIN